MGVDGHGRHKAVCESSIVTEISDMQPTHHTTSILMVTNLTSNHVDYINLCMVSKLVSKFSTRNYDGHIVSFLFTICNKFYNENMSVSYTINLFMVFETEINIDKS